MNNSDAELIYIGDPLCSWCWGAASEITQLAEQNKARLPFRILLGGLKPHTTHTMTDKQRHFLRQHWQEIHELSGQAFSHKILDNTDFVYNTEPPARAVYSFRQLAPELELEFFKAVQHAFYVQGKDTNRIVTYLDLCDEFFVEQADFKKIFEQEASKVATAEEFEQARMLGVMGFPTILLRVGEKHKALARGYEKQAQMQARLEHFYAKLQG